MTRVWTAVGSLFRDNNFCNLLGDMKEDNMTW